MTIKRGMSYLKLKVLETKDGPEHGDLVGKVGMLFNTPAPSYGKPAPVPVEANNSDGTKSAPETIDTKVGSFKKKLKEIKKAYLDSVKKRDTEAEAQNIAHTSPEKKQYAHVSQNWTMRNYNPQNGKAENPILDKQGTSLKHVDDLSALAHFHGKPQHKVSDTAQGPGGSDTYEIHPDGKLSYVKSKHDSRD